MKLVKSTKGMTIVEIVVALAILGFVSVGMTSFFTNSFKFQARSQQMTVAQKVADDTFERLKKNRGKITIKDTTIDITSEDGDIDGDGVYINDENYTYRITRKATASVSNGVTIYDVNLELLQNEEVIGSYNTTIRVNNFSNNSSTGTTEGTTTEETTGGTTEGTTTEETTGGTTGETTGGTTGETTGGTTTGGTTAGKTDGTTEEKIEQIRGEEPNREENREKYVIICYASNEGDEGVGGLPSETLVYAAGTYRVAITRPYRTYYNFSEWTDNKGNSYKPNAPITIEQERIDKEEDIILYAKWIGKEYKVNFDSNGGECAVENKSVRYKDTYGLLPVAKGEEKLGYTTLHTWKLNDEVITSDSIVNVHEEHTLVAEYSQSPNNYIVAYDGNGGVGTMESSIHTYDTTKTLTPNTYSRSRHTFMGWNTKSDGTGTAYSDKESVKNLVPTGTITLYAQWFACSHSSTTTTTVVATCTEKGSVTIKCSTCNKIISNTEVAAKGHNWGTWKVLLEAKSCQSPGVQERVCINCLKSEKQNINGKHVWSTEPYIVVPSTCTVKGSAVYYCSISGCRVYYNQELLALGHSWGDWTQIATATCVVEGKRQHKCENCSKIETESLGYGKHVWSSTPTTVVNATCVNDGAAVYHCINSGCSGYKNQTLMKLGHSWGDWKTTVEATCQVQKTQKRLCENCTATETQYLGYGVHVWSSTPTRIVGPTCTNDGAVVYHCINSGCSAYKNQTLMKLGHSWGDWTQIATATCLVEGKRQHKCENCSTVETESLGYGKHVWSDAPTRTVNPTCTNDGAVVYHCINSGCSAYKNQTLTKLGHSWGDWKTTVEATCQVQKTQKRLCENCTATETQYLGYGVHVWSSTPTRTVNPTCTNNGAAVYHCINSGCSEYKNQTLMKLGHSWGDWKTTAATCVVEGKKQRKCENCTTTETQSLGYGSHNYETSPSKTVASTCTKNGTSVYYCKNSGCSSYQTKTLTLASHSWGSYSTTKAATCTTPGEQSRKCNNCTATQTAPIAKKDHNRNSGGYCSSCGDCTHAATATTTKSATCTAAGSTTVKCKGCGKTMSSSTIAAKGHNYETSPSKTVASTCTKNGMSIYYCKNSGCSSYQTKKLALASHSWGSYSTTKAATCTSPGEKSRKCKNCSATQTAPISAKGHGSTDSEGKCEDCGKKI